MNLYFNILRDLLVDLMPVQRNCVPYLIWPS